MVGGVLGLGGRTVDARDEDLISGSALLDSGVIPVCGLGVRGTAVRFEAEEAEEDLDNGRASSSLSEELARELAIWYDGGGEGGV